MKRRRCRKTCAIAVYLSRWGWSYLGERKGGDLQLLRKMKRLSRRVFADARLASRGRDEEFLVGRGGIGLLRDLHVARHSDERSCLLRVCG